MKRMMIVGLRGGVGATTIAANVTLALKTIGQNVHAVDLNSENLLRLHFNMDPNSLDGWAVRKLKEQPWQEAGYQNNKNIAFVPFGWLTPDQHTDLENKILNHSFALQDIFSAEEIPEQEWQVMLLPSANMLKESHYSLIEQADMVLLVVTPDTHNYSALLQGGAYQQLQSYCQPKLLINQYHPASEVNHDMLLVLQNEFSQQYLPVVMHHDMAIVESISSLTSVLQYAPYSQAAQDYHALAFWCLSQTGRIKSKVLK